MKSLILSYIKFIKKIPHSKRRNKVTGSKKIYIFYQYFQ